MVQGIAHTALYTSLFDKTVQFYEAAFDAENLGFFQTDKRGCWLAIGADILEIFESPAYGDGCFKHIAIRSGNVDALFQKALDCGAASYVEPKDITLNLKQPRHARIAFVRGPGGEQIELFEEKQGEMEEYAYA